MGPFVWFTSFIVVSLPETEAPKGALHGSPLVLPEAWEAVVAVALSVGRGMGVSVGGGVGLGVSVGGMGVLVGMAAWVSATTVNAAATAVF